MSTVQGTANATSALSGSKGSTGSKSSVQETQDRFLKLLVTQMKNQDPLNPMDNAQVTTQMAQLSTVSGIDKLNTTLEAMSGSFASSQALQAAGMIGRGVLASGSSLVLQNGMAAGGFELKQPVDKAVVTIKDAAGNVLHRVNMGAQPSGIVTFQWDGVKDDGAPAPSGTYTFEVNATQNGQKVTADRLALGQVESVSIGSGGAMKLNTDGLGAVELAKVKQIF
jgi:flagellar basal-body rod modification protein FlgD